MELKQYPKYKGSDTEWFDEIPEDWCVKKLKHISNVRISNVDKKSKVNEPSVLLCNYIHVYKNGFITSKLKFMKATATKGQIAKLTLHRDDVLITKDSEEQDDIAVPALVTEDLEGVVCGYHLALITPYSDLIIGRYLFRSFQSKKINDQFVIEANGVTRFGLSTYPILNSFFIIPSKPEQIRISEFLDAQTQKLNATIKKNKQLIELFKEKRAALINQAVTRGLDPEVKLKDSGIEWINQIPESWELKRLKFLVDKIGSGITPKGGSLIYQTYGIPLIRSQNVHFNGLRLDDVAYISEEIFKTMLNTATKKHDVLLNITGASIGRCTFIEDEFEKGNVNQHVCIIRLLHKNYFYKYLNYFLMSSLGQDQILSVEMGTSREGLTFEQIGNLRLPLPSLTEQIQIAKYLENETSKIDSVIERIHHRIMLLEEYKKSLINSVVTGKIDVRHQIE